MRRPPDRLRLSSGEEVRLWDHSGVFIVFLPIAIPLLMAIDVWRFPIKAWAVAGRRRLVWGTVPILLVGAAFIPFGVWWFRSLILAADVTCACYVAKVRPSLGLITLMAGHQPSPHTPAPPGTLRIEAFPAEKSVESRLTSWLAPWDTYFGRRGARPRVVVINERGEEHVLSNSATWEETVEARDRMRDELLRVGLDGWRRLHGLPSDF